MDSRHGYFFDQERRQIESDGNRRALDQTYVVNEIAGNRYIEGYNFNITARLRTDILELYGLPEIVFKKHPGAFLSEAVPRHARKQKER